MIHPEENDFNKIKNEYNIVPVYTVLNADLETPLSIFMKTKGTSLLESVDKGENVGRHSIIGLGEKLRFTFRSKEIDVKSKSGVESFKLDNPLDVVREYFNNTKCMDVEGLPPFYGGALGYLGYETVQYFEDIPLNGGDDKIPDGILIIPECVLVYDAVKRVVYIVVAADTEEPDSYQRAVRFIRGVEQKLANALPVEEVFPIVDNELGEVHSNMTKVQYEKVVSKCKEHIVEGDIIQVVLSQRFSLETDAEPLDLYRTLRTVNPSPYLYFLDFGSFHVIGSSPEVMIRVRDGEMLLKPIAGTRPRGVNDSDDKKIAEELINDAKERSEHLMLVDLGRNDLGRCAVPGSIKVPDYMIIENYSHVMHIVSTITAKMDEKYDVFDVIKATFPAGTLSGAPKVEAMKLITKYESEKRGPYGGMVLSLGFNGNLNSCITIRTIVLSDGTASVQAGAGIVNDSVPEMEYFETQNKAMALLKTIKNTPLRRKI